MGTQEAPGPDFLQKDPGLAPPVACGMPEAAFGRPMMEGHGGLRATSAVSVPPWWFLYL